MSFLYSGSLWSYLYCGISLLWVGLYWWLVKVSWLGKLVSVFWWVELSYEMSMVLGWLWAACILELRIVFLCCWRICLVCLALELVGPCVVLDFSVGMEAFDELLFINVPLVSLISLKRSLVFPILLFSSISLHWALRKAFLSFLAILRNSAFKWCLSFSPLLFTSLLFTAICKASSDSHFAFLHFFFLEMVFIKLISKC